MSIPDGFILKEKVASLTEKILTKHPSLPTLLRDIRATIQANPEQVTLLSEEDINKIVSGLEIQTNTFLISSISAGKGTKSLSTKVKNSSVDDFGG